MAKAFEVGIDFIDTANVYARGAAEELPRRGARRSRPRDSYVLATKLYFPMSDDGPRAVARAGAQADRRLAEPAAHRLRRPLPVPPLRLRTTPLEETMEALTEVVRAGQGALPRLQRVDPRSRSGRRSTMPGVERFVSSQPQYSMLWRGPERDVIPAVRGQSAISQIVWSPLAQGVLTGKYKPGEPAARRLARHARTRWAASWARYSRSARSLERVQGCARSPTSSGSRWPSSRSPGCCARRTSPRRSSARAGRSRSRTTRPPPASSSAPRRSTRIDEILGDSVAWEGPAS